MKKVRTSHLKSHTSTINIGVHGVKCGVKYGVKFLKTAHLVKNQLKTLKNTIMSNVTAKANLTRKK